MVANPDIHIARRFHDLTTHTPHSVRTSSHTLDWDIKPFPFKVYPELPALPLPREVAPVAVDTLAALDSSATRPASAMTLEHLSTLLYLAAGVTKKKTYPGGGEVLFRAAASTGALYQTEVYVAAGAVEGLDPGLYHFCPGDFTLRRLRAGDVRAPLGEAAADPDVARRAATIVLTAIYWRNTWKYQARGWRHLYWDSGTMLANLTAAGQALGLTPRVLTGFADPQVNHLLGLDADREAALELVTLGPATVPAAPRPDLDDIRHDVMPLSSQEVDYPILREMQQASMLQTPDDVRSWRRSSPPASRAPRGPLTALPAALRAAGRALDDTIQRRASTRRFGHAPLELAQLATTLWWATRPVQIDVPAGLVDVFLVVNAVDSLEPGTWRYWPNSHALERLAAGEFRRQSAFLTLEQALGGDAAVTLYFLAPLNALLAAYGNRGYRLANLEAGLIGGRAYLVAYASGFGASGLTFYDGEVVRFFSPHAEGLDAIFVTALGKAGRSSC
ncbi:MAG TPA: SagB/ThcOx family dehydrogenase [Methylomirabilota bacterium]|nr:SagB/ThcOx family dehydrogenase [Methylomirabilota bacterium]